MKTLTKLVKRLAIAVGAVVVLAAVYLLVVALAPGVVVPAQPLVRPSTPREQAAAAATTSRSDVTFEVNGTRVSAWLYLPDDMAVPVPCVVMGPGAGGTKHMALPAYASRFRDAGFAALVFDYRYWGDSGGEPRHLLWIRDQLADWAGAIDYARSRKEIDPSRIVLWGTSFSGGHVLTTAAKDHRVAGVVAQVPFLDGLAAIELEREGDTLGLSLRSLMHAQRDLVRSWLHLSPHRIPIAGRSGTIALMPSQQAYDFFAEHAPAGFVNDAPARILIRADKYRPVTQARYVRCPVLLQRADRDQFVPASAIEETARILGEYATVRRYPIDHFAIYTGNAFETSVADQLVFLRKCLG